VNKAFWFGLILVVVGLVVALRGASYNDEKVDVNIGGIEARVVERESVPTWVGWTATGVGLVLMVAGLRRPREGHPLVP
jgi:hypothetical protein